MKALGIIRGALGLGGAAARTGAVSAAAGVAGTGILGGALANWGINIKADENDIRAKENFDAVANANRSEINLGNLFTQETGMSRLTNGREYNKWLAAKQGTRGMPKSRWRFNDPETIRHALGIGGVELNNPGNLRSWGSASTVERFRKGISIGRFAQFGSEAEGLEAMAGLLTGKGYAGAGIDSISAILNKYAPGSENNTTAYIGDVAKRTGLDPSAHLKLSDPKTLSSLMAAMIHHEQGRDPYTMDMITQSANRRLASQAAGNTVSVKLDQKTDIHVNGTGESGSTADLIAKEQNKVNASLARDFAGAVQ
jgi:hypothetical protein